MRFALVMAATVAGAALFAALHPAPRDAYEAAGTLVIPVRGLPPTEIEARTRQSAEMLRQPSIVGLALERAYQGSAPGDALQVLTVQPRPGAGVVRYSVRAATRETAQRLAEELGRVTVETLQHGRASAESFGVRIGGDFEFDREQWLPAGSDDGVAAMGLVPGGRYGGGALRVRCVVAAGCGASRVLEGHFPAGTPLTMTAWVRGRQPSNVLAVLSGGRNEDRTIENVHVGRSWKRVTVRWTPSRLERRVVLALSNAGPGISDVDLDGVLLLTAGGPLKPARERTVFAERSYAYATPVRIVDSRTGRTLRWAAVGAGAGLVVGLAGVLAWTLAARRRNALSA